VGTCRGSLTFGGRRRVILRGCESASRWPSHTYTAHVLDPSISVIVPTRQRPELLRRAVASIAEQAYEGEIEVIVVFDQETPVDPGVATRDGRTIRTMTNDRAPGLAGARNSGILASTADVVGYCDDDDEWLPGKARRQVDALAAAPEAEVVVTGATIVYEDRTFDRIPASPAVTLEDLLRSRAQEVHPSSIVARRTAVLDGIGLVDEDIPGSYGEDYEWLLRAARRTPILAVRDPLVRVHWHRSSFFADRWSTMADAIQYLLAKHPEFQREPLGLARLYGRLAFANAAMGNRSEARAWARKTLRLNPRERRAYLALAVSTGAVSVETLMKLAHRRGRGI
jgi:glycosyltransferase involved in cell wall biosynthesis